MFFVISFYLQGWLIPCNSVFATSVVALGRIASCTDPGLPPRCCSPSHTVPSHLAPPGLRALLILHFTFTFCKCQNILFLKRLSFREIYIIQEKSWKVLVGFVSPYRSRFSFCSKGLPLTSLQVWVCW